MYERTSSRIEDITPKRADAFLKLNTFEGQRRLDRSWVKELAGEMKSGTFRRGEISFAENGNAEQVLMNGQHQCAAGSESGCTFPAAVDRYHCASTDDLWKLYGTFDGHKVRSVRDILRAASGRYATTALNAVPHELLKLATSYIPSIRLVDKPVFPISVRRRIDRVKMLDQYAADVLVVLPYYSYENRSALRVAVCAAIVKCHDVAGDLAKEFWLPVIYGNDLKLASLQHKLRRIIDQGVRSNRAGVNSRASQQMMYGSCIAYWNAWADGTGKPKTAGTALLTTYEPAIPE